MVEGHHFWVLLVSMDGFEDLRCLDLLAVLFGHLH